MEMPVWWRLGRGQGRRLLTAVLLASSSVVQAADAPAPAGAPAAVPPVASYGQLPAVTFPILSHSGRRFAMVVNVADQRRLVIQELYGKVLMIAELGDVKVRSVSWAGEDLVLVHISATQNLGMRYGFEYELSSFATFDINTQTVTWPINESGLFNAAFGYYGAREFDHRWYAFIGMLPLSRSTGSGAEWLSSGVPQLMRIDLLKGKTRLVASQLGGGRGWVLDSKGEVVARQSYDAAGKSWCLKGRKPTGPCLVKRQDEFGKDDVEGLGREPGTVIYEDNNEDGNVHYMELALDGSGPPAEILADSNIDHFLFDPVTYLASGARLKGPGGKVIMFDSRRQLAVNTVLHTFSQDVVSIASWSDDCRRFFVHTEGNGDSGTWWFVDLAINRGLEFGHSYPDISASQVGANRAVKYHAADGLDMEGFLTLPPGAEPRQLPLVVLPHGGPEARDYQGFDWLAQAFASRGYAVWQPNYRGSGGYGAAFRNAGMGEWGRKMQTDISDGVAELARLGIVDPHRACIVGASYGGYAALAGVTVQQGLYRCAVSYAGVADLADFFQQEYGGARRYWRAYMGIKGPVRRDVADISPAALAERADAPILLIHGKDDTVVEIDQSYIMKRALERAHKPVEFLMLEGEDHYLSKQATRVAMLEAAVAFVQRYNPAATP
jgi:dienelactone hydrolase